MTFMMIQIEKPFGLLVYIKYFSFLKVEVSLSLRVRSDTLVSTLTQRGRH